MLGDAFLFWFLSLIIVSAALSVILFSNPIYSALSLVMSMVGVSAIFVTLGAYFLAGVQTIVYTGAVMVLFIMVLMLFDLKKESASFSRGKVSGFLKIASVGILAGLLVGAIVFSVNTASGPVLDDAQTIAAGSEKAVQAAADIVSDSATKRLSTNLFINHILAFEVLGVLLLVIAIGVVALAKSKGGTHARH